MASLHLSIEKNELLYPPDETIKSPMHPSKPVLQIGEFFSRLTNVAVSHPGKPNRSRCDADA
jgi:hypothetical protein